MIDFNELPLWALKDEKGVIRNSFSFTRDAKEELEDLQKNYGDRFKGWYLESVWPNQLPWKHGE